MCRFAGTTSTLKLRLLSKDALDAIHWATLDVLERTDIKIFSDKVLKMPFRRDQNIIERADKD